MVLTVSERIFILVRCQHCDQGTEKILSWLNTHNWMLCPTCGHRIDLRIWGSAPPHSIRLSQR